MIKNSYIILDNGLKLILCENKDKNQLLCSIYVNYGGEVLSYESNGIKYEIKQGTAHLLEHVVCESSIFGNINEYFYGKDIKHNGITNKIRTHYFINCVDNYKKNVLDLLDIVNKTVFNEDTLKNILPPVLQEVKKDKDRQGYEYSKAYTECVYKKNKCYSVLGESEELENIKIDELERIYNTFYQPKNQTIYLMGNFDTEEAIENIKNYYNNLNKKEIDFKVLDKEDTCEINKKYKEIEVKHDLDKIGFNYKMDVSNLTPKERNYLTYYLAIYFDMKFRDSSDLYKKLKEQKLVKFSTNINYHFENKNILIITFIYHGTNLDKIKELHYQTLNDISVDEELLENEKYKNIAMLIMRNGSFYDKSKSYLSNIFDFEYEKEDEVEELDKINVDSYIKYIGNLKWNNEAIIVQKNIE